MKIDVSRISVCCPATRAGASRAELKHLIQTVWASRADRGAEERLNSERQHTLIPVTALKKDAHLEMHTRGG